MTNDGMTKEIPMTKIEENISVPGEFSAFGFRHSFAIGHSTFVIFQHGDKNYEPVSTTE